MARGRPSRDGGIVIRDARASFIWALAVPEVFAQKHPKGLAALSSGPAYRAIFKGAGDGPAGVEEGVIFPWPRDTGQNFWMRYLERPSLAGLSADLAWSRLVPLRKRLGVMASDDDPPLSLVLELFAYPHGLALVASTRIDQSMDIEALVDRMADIRSGRTVSADFGSKPVSGRLGDVATQVLRHLAYEELDVRDTTGDGSLEAFSVVTIVAAEGLPAAPATTLDDHVARSLYGLASWSPTWRDDPLPDPAKVGVTRPSKPQGHVVYTGDRGRVVWFPRLFGEVSHPRHTLSCYHRNQVLLALTAESLTSMLRTTRTRLASEGWLALPKNERDCAVHAGDCLVRLYRGEATYRSRAVTIQLEANGGRAAFDALAVTLGREALGAPP